MNEALISMHRELNTAFEEYPPFNSAHEGFSILKEEVDELWDAVKLKQGANGRLYQMQFEAAQVAAMAIRFLIEVKE